MIRGVVFDMDGVLFDTERISCESWAAAAREVGIPELAQAISAYFGLNAKDSRALFESTYGDRLTYDEWVERTNGRTGRYIDETGVPVKTGVRELLDYLKRNGIRIAMATSTRRERAEEYLRRTRLIGYFDRIVAGDMVTRGKPEPDIYLTACAELGLAPAEVVAIEDSFNGMRSAAAAGTAAVMVPDRVQPTEEIRALAHCVCGTLLEVPAVIDALNRS